MKILIIASTFWPDYAGWVNQVLGLINSYGNKDDSFTVLTRENPDRDRQDPVLQNIELVNLRPSITIQNSVSRFLFLFPVLFYMLKNRAHFDTIFLPTAYLPLPFVIPVAKWLGKPVVSRIAINELIGTNLYSRIRKFLILGSDAIVCLNEQTMKGIAQNKNGKPIVRLIPNGIDDAKRTVISQNARTALKNELGFSNDEKLVCFAGLINKRKGVDTLIKSFSRMKNAHPKTHLLLVGPYQDAGEIEPQFVQDCHSLVQDSTMEDRIHFIGRVDDLKEYLSISDVFVLPSLSEGMPNVLLEAMAAGLPCVCSDISGIREVITPEKNGILVEPGDIAGFSRAISRLLSNPEACSRMGQESMRRIEREHTMHKVSQMYQDLFSELLEHD